MTKAELKEKAFKLAMSELMARSAYEKALENDQEKNRLKEYEKKVDVLTKEASDIRNQLPSGSVMTHLLIQERSSLQPASLFQIRMLRLDLLQRTL